MQVALLYTTAFGERRIRVHTLALPVTDNPAVVFEAADAQAIAGLLAKMGSPTESCVFLTRYNSRRQGSGKQQAGRRSRLACALDRRHVQVVPNAVLLQRAGDSGLSCFSFDPVVTPYS